MIWATRINGSEVGSATEAATSAASVSRTAPARITLAEAKRLVSRPAGTAIAMKARLAAPIAVPARPPVRPRVCVAKVLNCASSAE